MNNRSKENIEIDKNYLDRFIKNYVFQGELKRLYKNCNSNNEECIKHLKELSTWTNDKKIVLQYKALIEYVENNEELPEEYKCLEEDKLEK